MGLTTKQAALMDVIINANPDGTLADLDQILERLSYETTKQSLQFSLRALVDKDCICHGGRELRRGKSRVTYEATQFGIDMARPAHSVDQPISDKVDVPDVFLGLNYE